MDTTRISLDDLDINIPVDFDQLDEWETEGAEYAREVLSGLPARPGTIRR